MFDECTINAEKSVQEAVDIRLLTDNSTSTSRVPGKANLNVGNQFNLKANLWAALDEMVDHLHLSVLNVQQLQRVLFKKRDPLSHVLFAHALEKEGHEPNLSLKFWQNLVGNIQKQLKKAAQYNHVIKSAFEQGAYFTRCYLQRGIFYKPVVELCTFFPMRNESMRPVDFKFRKNRCVSNPPLDKIKKMH